jgi:hypothetical protein
MGHLMVAKLKFSVGSIYFEGIGCVDDGKIQNDINDLVPNGFKVVTIARDSNLDKPLYLIGLASLISR